MSEKQIVHMRGTREGWVLPLALAFLLFFGDPCIAESLRVAAENWANSLASQSCEAAEHE